MSSTGEASTCVVNKRPSGRCMCKSSYNKLLTKLKDYNLDDGAITEIGEYIQDLFSFDPDGKYENRYKGYSEKNLESIRRYREKKKLEGINTYISSGKKASYEKKKAEKATAKVT